VSSKPRFPDRFVPVLKMLPVLAWAVACAASTSKQPPVSPDAAGSGSPGPAPERMPPAGTGGTPGSVDGAAPGDSPPPPPPQPTPPPADAMPTGSPDSAPPTTADAAPAAEAGNPSTGGGRILVYSHTTGNRHVHIPRAVMTVKTALSQSGYTVETSEDPAWFTPARLQPLAAIILLSTTGHALGDPGTEGLAALDGYVKSGGVLIGLHAASSTFYDPSQPLTRLIGGKFVDHPGGVRRGTCHAEGSHPAVARLPEPFVTTDEIYVMSNLRPDNQVILTCDAFGENRRLPIAWYRQGVDGPGRIFYTSLGHQPEDWSPTSPYFRDHALPGMLWALGK
jgi:type 1 glutamine amidotransferase